MKLPSKEDNYLQDWVPVRKSETITINLEFSSYEY